MTELSAVGVFCGSSPGRDPRHLELARSVGATLAARGLTLVYGGGQVGLMGAVADACLDGGGRVIGVIPGALFDREVVHPHLGELHEVGSMHERKALMYDRSDGFLALPGGLGTLDELCEVATWAQLGLHAKALVLVDVDGFWDPFVAMLDRMVQASFLLPRNRGLILRAATVDEALQALADARPEDVAPAIGLDR
jgi:uncharacterized protein (TIGR00730 family)